MVLSGVQDAERRYGVPVMERIGFPMRAHEFLLLRRSMCWGRQHDTTLFILDGTQIAVIRKPTYPPGVYRPPSGGVHPGETLEEGSIREAYEETGLRIHLKGYLLRVFVDFSHGADRIPWTTHLFTAEPVEGNLKPIDTREIVEARWIAAERLLGDMRDRLLAAGSLGLVYRAHLQCRALSLLWKAKVKDNGGGIQEDFMD